MANTCSFTISAVGKKRDLEELHQILSYKHPDNLGFYRVYLAHVLVEGGDELSDEDITSADFLGECAWSVEACMFDAPMSYYQINDGENNEEAIDMVEASKKLNLEIEIYSEELGLNFQEHYVVKNGELIVDEYRNIESYYDEDKGDYIITGGFES